MPENVRRDSWIVRIVLTGQLMRLGTDCHEEKGRNKLGESDGEGDGGNAAITVIVAVAIQVLEERRKRFGFDAEVESWEQKEYRRHKR